MPCVTKWKKMKYGQLRYSIKVEVCDEDDGENAAAAVEDDSINWAQHALNAFAVLGVNPHADATPDISTGLGAAISCKFDPNYDTEEMAEAMLAMSTAQWAGNTIGNKLFGCTEDIA